MFEILEKNKTKTMISKIINQLKKDSFSFIETTNEQEIKRYRRKGDQFLYLIVWNLNDSIFSWGL